MSDGIVRGFEPGGFKNISGILTFSVWLCGILILAERRSGYIITLLWTCRRQDRQLRRKALLGLDANRSRRDFGHIRYSVRARTVEHATDLNGSGPAARKWNYPWNSAIS